MECEAKKEEKHKNTKTPAWFLGPHWFTLRTILSIKAEGNWDLDTVQSNNYLRSQQKKKMSFIAREYHFDHSMKSAKKFSAVQGLKKVLKPLMKIIKKQQFTLKTIDDIQTENDFNASLEDMQRENYANEMLQQRIFSEIEQCDEDAAIYVVQGNRRHIVSVEKTQTFVPVNFVRTESGTFFWTSMETIQQQQFYSPRDRWAQA